MPRILAGLLLASLLTGTGEAFAARPAADVRVLIDVSGSMKQTDPDYLRRSALALFIDLLPQDTLAGVWIFAKGVARLVPHGTVDARWRERAAAAVGRVHSRGLFTDIESALAKATRGWEEPAGDVARHLILLTDGVVDISKQPEPSAASRERILADLLPRLVESDVKVHAIGLENETDEALLRRLTLDTGGLLLPAAEADRLERVFLALLEESAPRDTVPLRDGVFTIDASIDEMTLLVFRADDGPQTTLTDPSGEIRAAGTPGAGANWRQQGRYELITIREPDPGEWRIEPSRDPDNRVMVVTDLSLELGEVSAYLAPGSREQVTAMLTAAGAPLEAEGIADFVEWSATLESDAAPTAALAGAGTGAAGYTLHLGGSAPEGPASIVITADSGTFTRQARRRVEFRRPVAIEPIEDAAGAVVALRVAPRPESVVADGFEVTAALEGPNGERTVLLARSEPDGGWRIDLVDPPAPGRHAVRLEIGGQSPSGAPFTASLVPLSLTGPQPAPAPPAPEPPPAPAPSAPDPADGLVQVDPTAPTSWAMTGGVLLIANLVIIALVLLVLRHLRPPGADVLDSLLEEPAPA